MDWWVQTTYQRGGLVPLVAWIFWVIGSISLHELGHGFAAIKLGDSTPRDSGHMTLNPLVHMGQTSLIIFALLGIAFGAMPVDPSRLRGRHGEAIVALAGPAVNLILATICLIALPLWIALAGGYLTPSVQTGDALFKNMQTFLFQGAMLNIVLMLFNLVPILPLDGGRVLTHYWRGYREFSQSENGRWVVLGVFILIFFTAGEHLFKSAVGITEAVNTAILSLIAPGAI
ncbi:MAG: Zn-dependent protease [Phycisphaerales bacterium]|jgi:Zn-dependent protease